MILEAVVIGGCAFGAAAFCFLAGLAVGVTTNKPGAATFPPTHVSFDPDLSNEKRLSFLDEAAQAVRAGKLRQPKKLGDDTASDEGK